MGGISRAWKLEILRTTLYSLVLTAIAMACVYWEVV